MNGNFTTLLLDWYTANGRDLPWRRSSEPYGVWVSEIMAQQTQIDRVIGYYDRWMNRFPDIAALAEADEEDVLKLWEGLGYYSRARNMLKAADVMVREHGGNFPSDYPDIRSLPGIGEYTAGAIASIAFGQPEPAVDANVLRVFARLTDESQSVRETEAKRRITKWVLDFMPNDRPGDYNQALMELGALVCSKSPKCNDCPVNSLCLAHERGTVADRPVLPTRKQTVRVNMATGVLVHSGRVLIQKRRPDDVWPGLWEFPGGVMESGETPEQTVVREYKEEVGLDVEPFARITVISYSYTRYRVTMHCYLCRPVGGQPVSPIFHEAEEGLFVFPDQLEDYAFPAGQRRLIDYMRSDGLFNAI